MTALLHVTEFTDPSCPFAWSAEPARRRISWLYGEQLEWEVRMVGLADDPSVLAAHGFTPEKLADSFRKLAEEYGMPIDTTQRSRLAASTPACRTVVAVRHHSPEHARGLLRALRVLHFSGWLLDEPETLEEAARMVGLPPAQVRRWDQEPESQALLRDDLRQAREPLPEAVALRHKLASNGSGGYRYTCPSYVIRRPGDGQTLVVPGFQPVAAYEVAVANLAPSAVRRDDPTDVEEVLRWAGEPLASAEVAAVCELSSRQAREALGRVAAEQPLGADGLWSLR